jgi:hypothetical protein
MTGTSSLVQAEQRLVQTRERLRNALAGIPPSSPGESRTGFEAGNALHEVAAAASIRRSLTRLAFATCNRVLAPTASRHPWRLVLGAASLGAALVWVRPWRWAPQALLVGSALRPWLQPLLMRAATRIALAGPAASGAPVRPPKQP